MTVLHSHCECVFRLYIVEIRQELLLLGCKGRGYLVSVETYYKGDFWCAAKQCEKSLSLPPENVSYSELL